MNSVKKKNVFDMNYIYVDNKNINNNLIIFIIKYQSQK